MKITIEKDGLSGSLTTLKFPKVVFLKESENAASPLEVIKLVANDITDRGLIDWDSIKVIYGKELDRSDEIIRDTFLNVWSTYTKDIGIEMQRSAEPEQKLLLVIHEYRHFYGEQSGNYSIRDEDIDDVVRGDVKYLMKLIEKEKSIVKTLEDLGKTWDFEKLFGI